MYDDVKPKEITKNQYSLRNNNKMPDLSVHTALCWDRSRGCRDTVAPVCRASYTGCTCHMCVGALSWCCLGRHYKLSLWNQNVQR